MKLVEERSAALRAALREGTVVAPGAFNALAARAIERRGFGAAYLSGAAVSNCVLGVPDKPGIAAQILCAVADANIEVDVIIQNISKDGKTDFSFTVHRNDYAKTVDLLNSKVVPALGAASVEGDSKICKVSIVGIGMRSHVGVASKMFRVLSEEGINIQMISTSEIKTSVVIDEKYMELAVRALHKAFDLDQVGA